MLITAEPPERFLLAIESPTMVRCLKEHCGLFMVVDAQMFMQMQYEVRIWKATRAADEPVPLQLLRLAMMCLNGHLEVWRAAEPTLVPDTHALLPDVSAEDQPERLCGRCGKPYQGRKYQQACEDCKTQKSNGHTKKKAPVAADCYQNGTGMKKLAPEERERSREEWKQKFLGHKQQGGGPWSYASFRDGNPA